MTIQELNYANIALDHITKVVEQYRSDETTQIVAETGDGGYWLISNDFGDPLTATWHSGEQQTNNDDRKFDDYATLQEWLFENYTTEDYTFNQIFEIYIENI